jgi:chromosome segregation ATPase
MVRAARRKLRRGRSHALAAGLCVSLACATSPAYGPVETATPYAREGASMSRDAAVARDREVRNGTSADHRARRRLLGALALLVEDERREADAIAELRAVEHEHGTLVWGHVARILVLGLTRRDARLRLLRDRLLTSQSLVEDQARSIAGLREERKELQDRLEVVGDQLRAQSERIVELQRELEALKQIDMRRNP